mmetsp:Transcript_3755/g.5418  ORF Transcript_3755/g.5418 Transcript_3755/m.5418 type:complete len:328 (-) Transcript_3755:1639-2622(-)
MVAMAAAMDADKMSITSHSTDTWTSLGKIVSGFCNPEDEEQDDSDDLNSKIHVFNKNVSSNTKNSKAMTTKDNDKHAVDTSEPQTKPVVQVIEGHQKMKSSIHSRIAFFESSKETEKGKDAKPSPPPRRIIIRNPYRPDDNKNTKRVERDGETNAFTSNDVLHQTRSAVHNDVFRTRNDSSVSVETEKEETKSYKSYSPPPRQVTTTARPARTMSSSSLVGAAATTKPKSRFQRYINFNSWVFDAFLVLLIIVMSIGTMYNLGYKVSFSIDIKITNPSNIPTDFGLTGGFSAKSNTENLYPEDIEKKNKGVGFSWSKEKRNGRVAAE